jgi:ribose 1,5-bisphosphokinase PhnN
MLRMNQVSPPSNRISAALRALRRLYNESATDKAVLGLKSLRTVMAERLRERGRQGQREER